MQDAAKKLSILKDTSFGQRVAEEDLAKLKEYFVKTDQWFQLYNGQVDIVFGAKGSGKSALYFLIQSYRPHFRSQAGVVLVSAENPRGATAFRTVSGDGSISEAEFLALWKLYFAGVLATSLVENNIKNDNAKDLFSRLHAAGVWADKITLSRLLSGALDYVKRLFRPSAMEGTLEIDPITGMPKGIKGKILFSEPTSEERNSGAISVDELLRLADKAFIEEQLSCWVLLDRLDVAFADTPEMESRALRALFRAYLDINGLDVVFIKIFLRSDIWERITRGGFREASHITRHATISWTSNELLNLCIRRLISNSTIVDEYSVDKEQVFESIESQRALFYKIFPDQVEVGPNKPGTFEWMLGRTKDGTKENAPRELIHFLGRLREIQMKSLEIRDGVPDGDILFARQNFKEALVEVSSVRLHQTLLAEYPSIRNRLMQLEGRKAEHSAETLADLWGVGVSEAKEQAEELVSIGFFEKRGDRQSPRYWIPFLYRDALSIVQGSAD